MATAAFCSGCGTAIAAGSQFCPSCGQRVSVASPAWSGATDVEIAATYTYAGFWLRFVASIIDLIILSVVSAFVGAIIAGGDDTGTVSAMLNLFGDWLYRALMESSKFQGTVGKIVLGLVVTDDQYRPISFGRATGRYLGHILSAIILGIGFIMAAFTTRKQCLHDIMAGTLVVKKPSGYVRT
jgi:uncharacterized RDD family membrane protein YckC